MQEQMGHEWWKKKIEGSELMVVLEWWGFRRSQVHACSGSDH